MPASVSNQARGGPGEPATRCSPGFARAYWILYNSLLWTEAKIRIHTGRQHRVLYIARFEEGVYVLHAFEKRSRKTLARHIEVARNRLREVRATKRRVR